MATFDPEKFEDKYVFYLPELEAAYKAAFEIMNERYDSDLVHAIDQRVLNESEPVYDGDGEFRIDLPDDLRSRIDGVLVNEEKLDAVIEAYVQQLEAELRTVFGFDTE